MELIGKITKDGKFWLAEVEGLDIMTQGKTRKDALMMIKDAIELVADVKGFSVTVKDLGDNLFSIEPSDEKVLYGLSIKRLRSKMHIAREDLAEALEQTSTTTIARYERYESKPKTEQYSRMLSKMNTSVMLRLGKA